VNRRGRAAGERAHLLLLTGTIALRDGRLAEACRLAEELGREAAGMLDLQLLGLHLAMAAYAATGREDLARHAHEEWTARTADLAPTHVRRLVAAAERLGYSP
jgi:hypothetical protein